MKKDQSKKLAEALVRAVEGAKQPGKEVRMTFDSEAERESAAASLRVILKREGLAIEPISFISNTHFELMNGSCVVLRLRR